MKIEFDLDASRVVRRLTTILLLLTGINILGCVSRLAFGHDNLGGLIPMFDFDEEMNVPTFYSSVILLSAAVLLFLIANGHKQRNEPYRAWNGLAGVFFFLSMDETVQLHEKLISLGKLLKTTGLFYHAWVIPYGIAFLVFVVIYLKFTLALPQPTRRLFFLSGTIYVLGAVVFEMLGGLHRTMHGSPVLGAVLYTTEEFLEMGGVILFIYTLLQYMASQSLLARRAQPLIEDRTRLLETLNGVTPGFSGQQTPT